MQGVIRGYNGLPGVTTGYRGLKEVTGGYKGLQGVTGNIEGLQGVTMAYQFYQRNIVFVVLFTIQKSPEFSW